MNYELKAQGNDYYVILSLHNNMVRFAGDRFTDVELLLTERSGLKIPNSSITEKAFYTVPKEYFTRGGDSNSLGLYVRDSKTNAVNFVATAIFRNLKRIIILTKKKLLQAVSFKSRIPTILLRCRRSPHFRVYTMSTRDMRYSSRLIFCIRMKNIPL